VNDRHVRLRRQRALAGVLVGGAAIAFVAGAMIAAGDGGSSGTAARAAVPPAPPNLPRGGRRIFPEFRVVAYYGAPQNRELGALGIGTPDQAGRRLARTARAYGKRTRPALPAMELIATIAQAAPGRDGMYRERQTSAVIRRYLAAARRMKALLMLDIQPGRADFGTEVRALERWLREPDVSLALDPEWHVGPGEVPGKTIGSTDAATVNAVARWLERIVARDRLPQKLLVVHQFTPNMIRDREQLRPRPGVALTVNVDGFGWRAVKIAKYHEFAQRGDAIRDGLKLFYEEDTNLLTPGAVLDLLPRPDLVVYE
jgi:hypothetical protein